MKSLLSLFFISSISIGFSQLDLIPKPYFVKSYDTEKFSIEHTKVVVLTSDSFYTENYVKNFFNSDEKSEKMSRIDISFDPQPEAFEAYHIKIFKDVIIIIGGRAGVYYALQTVKQLSEKGDLQVCEIMDFPNFKYRGMHLDVCRHFYTVEEIKRYLDLMARYKFNRFHWHLTEDQGWRIEIKRYPNLTKIGSQRKETLIGKQKDAEGKGDYDKTPHGGFYTQDQVREIVKYAKDRQIFVIPEIELPGHSLAAIASYPSLGCFDRQVEVGTRWGVYDDVFCAGKESTFEFIQNVLDEVIDLFPNAYIHIGGDEVVKTNWKKCTMCQKRIKENNLKDEHELQSYFIQRVEKYLNSKGKQIIGWDEILEGGLAPNATVMSWRGTSGGVEAAKARHMVVMTPGKPCYFDHGQSKNKLEPLNIGGKNTYMNVYNYNPNPAGIVLDSLSAFILGAQGNVWTEYISTWSQIEYMVVPRMIALSESVWTQFALKDSANFQERLGSELERLDKSNINYRLPEPLGFYDTISVDNPYLIDLKPLSKSHHVELSLDNVPIKNNESIQPTNKDRVIRATVSNGKRKSIPYEMILKKKKD